MLRGLEPFPHVGLCSTHAYGNAHKELQKVLSYGIAYLVKNQGGVR